MRGKTATKRIIPKDPLYQSRLVTKLITRSMKDGKRAVAETNIYTALELVKTKTKKDPIEVLDAAIKNISPQMEVRSRRVGGAAYQVPTPVRPNRAVSLVVRWMIIEATKRPNKEYHTFSEKLAAEIIDAANNEGGAVQKKSTMHKMADANKAFAHFRW
ncbi:30S ribosomal protein S7 [Microgenomates group bacterium RIFCSPLOWO2_01_FULL_47_10]|nr:MAG: 30S ribosomal protein S7 [Microgenomates group bacterium RIFCSPLOWO2_01_FULL_47_10]